VGVDRRSAAAVEHHSQLGCHQILQMLRIVRPAGFRTVRQLRPSCSSMIGHMGAGCAVAGQGTKPLGRCHGEAVGSDSPIAGGETGPEAAAAAGGDTSENRGIE
jgi:hypothetical protein